MSKKYWLLAFVAVATCATLSAATCTWIGGTGTKVWGTTSNWQNGAVPGDGDTAQFNHTSGTVTFSAAVTLPANIVFNIAKQRQGDIGSVAVIFDPGRMRYLAIEREE